MNDFYYSSPGGYLIQKTLKESVRFQGIGLHTGAQCQISLEPAPENHGLIFRRVDLKQSPKIFAHYSAVIATQLATSLGYVNDPDIRIFTVEHLLASLYAMGITNLLILVHGPEIPILDGSSAPFLEGILGAGIQPQAFSSSVIKILKPIKIYQRDTICELLPRDTLRLTASIDFPHPAIGPQTYALDLTPQAFQEQVSMARTFGFLKDQASLKKHKLALGASLNNVLAFSDEGVLNPEGTRFSDECVRHKILDAIGDLALCGSWIHGEMVSFRGGHSIHITLLKTLKAHPTHWVLNRAESLSQPTVHVQREKRQATYH